MKKLITLAFVAVLAGCGSTETRHDITTEERNPAWSGEAIRRIAVLAVSDDRVERISSEEVFADRMTSGGIDTIATHGFVPKLDLLDSDAELASLMGEKNVDAVLALALIEPVTEYDRSAYWSARGWAFLLGSNNSRAWGDLADTASYWQQGRYSLEITLWDARTAEYIWRAETDSKEWDNGQAGVEKLADAVGRMLQQRGLVK